jgi:hypothetical protein
MADNRSVKGMAINMPAIFDWLPLRLLGLDDIPGVAFVPEQLLGTVLRLGLRTVQILPAKNALSNTYTIGGVTATGYAFLYGDSSSAAAANPTGKLADALHGQSATAMAALIVKAITASGASPAAVNPVDPLTQLSLDAPEQFAMAWTNFQGFYQNALPLLPKWSATLTDPAVAAQLFWPTIAGNGLAYNALILQKVDAAKVPGLKVHFQGKWTPAWDALVASGSLYAIDLSIFTTLTPDHEADGSTRFTPATVTLLQQDAAKALTPIAVWAAGYQGSTPQVYLPGDGAWLYALLAAKTSVTVYGTWLGHVYHWHIVTGAMQQTMFNNLEKDSALYQLVAPQSDFLNAFDNVLLLTWLFNVPIAPPTSVASALQFLTLCNAFATGRTFFDDNPLVTLQSLGLQQADFTVHTPWDQYPVVGHLLKIWDATAAYVNVFVTTSYKTDAAVANDAALQAWMADAANPSAGNIRGLPPMVSRDALAKVLTSLLYRVTAHGSGRLPASSNPGLTFIPNWPQCLQEATLPPPGPPIATKALLKYLPKTGTMGAMLAFYNTFAFSVPYEPFIPLDGIEAKLFFPGGSADPRNEALVTYRKAIAAMINELSAPFAPQITQWPLNVET